MKLEMIEKLWVEDADINPGALGAAALEIPRLHAKWYKVLMEEKRILYALSMKKDDLAILLEAYFSKTLTAQELKDANLPDYTDKKILRPDFPKHIQNYPEMVDLNLKIAVQTDKIEFVKDVLKQIHGRSFIIKDAIAWAMFEAGAR